MLNKKAIFECDDIQSKEVSVPEWGGNVMVYGLTAGEKDMFETSLVNDKKVDLKDATAKLCVLCIRDGNGDRIFTDIDIEKLSGKSGKALKRVYEVAESLSGLARGDVEEIVKNSEKTQTDVSS